MLKLIKENIPQKLRDFNNWVGITIIDEGKKVPIDPKIENDGRWASISDPSTWGSYEQAVKTVEVGLCVSVGFAMTPAANLIFVDLDCHTEKLKTEEEKEKLRKHFEAMCRAVAHIQTYQEKSLSGEGVHLLATGSLEEGLKVGASKIAPVEIYQVKRFITMTGHRINNFDIDDSEKVVGSLRNLHKNYFEKKSPADTELLDRPLKGVIDTEKYKDEEVLKVALQNEKFRLLWEGQWDKVVDKEGNQKYTQQHYADFALIRKLTFYTSNHPDQVERLFKQSPCFQAYGQGGKWAKFESDIKKDIQTASSTCTAVYTPKSDRVAASTAVDTSKSDNVATITPTDTAVIEDDIWIPDFKKIYRLLFANKDNQLILNCNNKLNTCVGNKVSQIFKVDKSDQGIFQTVPLGCDSPNVFEALR